MVITEISVEENRQFNPTVPVWTTKTDSTGNSCAYKVLMIKVACIVYYKNK